MHIVFSQYEQVHVCTLWWQGDALLYCHGYLHGTMRYYAFKASSAPYQNSSFPCSVQTASAVICQSSHKHHGCWDVPFKKRLRFFHAHIHFSPPSFILEISNVLSIYVLATTPAVGSTNQTLFQKKEERIKNIYLTRKPLASLFQSTGIPLYSLLSFCHTIEEQYAWWWWTPPKRCVTINQFFYFTLFTAVIEASDILYFLFLIITLLFYWWCIKRDRLLKFEPALTL